MSMAHDDGPPIPTGPGATAPSAPPIYTPLAELECVLVIQILWSHAFPHIQLRNWTIGVAEWHSQCPLCWGDIINTEMAKLSPLSWEWHMPAILGNISKMTPSCGSNVSLHSWYRKTIELNNINQVRRHATVYIAAILLHCYNAVSCMLVDIYS